MRLLNSATIQLEEVVDDCIPSYAILSHRWQDDEVSLQDMQSTKATKKAGYAKLKMCCDQAAKDGLKYVWVDTCCIDKTSSAGLSESINSMYRWYQNAAICYAYLFDVQSMKVSNDSSFDDSVWFTRGWTLQELIAPSIVEFYNSTWHKLGTKESLKNEISAITGIDVEVLKGADPEDCSVAKRMSWASKRTTMKLEDIAYSLLGLFGVNMPMLYGEGERAFIRLQEEIMKNSDDHSLFAWSSTDKGYRGLLAKSPADFRDCHNIVTSSPRLNRVPYSVTNMGLSIELRMIAWAMDTYLVALDCEAEETPNSRVGIFLKLLPKNNQCARVMLDGTDRRTFDWGLVAKSGYQKIYVQQKVWSSRPAMDRMYGFWLRSVPEKVSAVAGKGREFAFCRADSWNEWNQEERIVQIPTGSRGTAVVLWYITENYKYSVLRLGFDTMFNPVCQYGGPMWGSTWQLHFPDQDSFEAKMDAGWMQEGTDWVIKGNRLRGLEEEANFARISIKDEVVENRRMWVVDVERISWDEFQSRRGGGGKHNARCDGCNSYIYGTRHKCLVCVDFDYCSQCFLKSSETHPLHEFRAIEIESK